ncbi:mandelate racemase [Flammeovirgaceae bacterium 311]|nr:mandelate racemase [Flammeovirgaceae bacterium 311]
MHINRRKFIATSVKAAALGIALPSILSNAAFSAPLPPGYPKMLDLHKAIPNPVIIKSIEFVKANGELFLITTSEDGERGITMANFRMPNLLSLLHGLVIPNFIGKDARDIETLLDEVFVKNSNYKYGGMSFWNCVGHVEISIFDLLGKVANKPVNQLLGKVLRDEVPVYLSSLTRETTPQEEVANLAKRLEVTGVKAVKFKVGGRMSNPPEMHKRSVELIPLIRKTLGDNITLYADANGSYTVKEGIEIGKMLQDQNVAIFEEPCFFEQYENNKAVADALSMKVAGGEQDTSFPRFEWIIKNKGLDVLQPDLYYNGGFIRCLRVAQLAAQHGLEVAPHSPKTDPLAAAMLHFTSVIPNLVGYQEVAGYKDPGSDYYTPPFNYFGGSLKVPEGPGLGVVYDEAIWKKIVKL